MRTLYVISLVLLTGCAAHPTATMLGPVRSVPGTTLPAEGIESVRYAENIKAYPTGRYIDPNNHMVMHDAHVVYRVETTGKWNLHPNPPVPVPSGPVTQVIDPAHQDSPVTAEVIVEINRQKAATQLLIDQGARLNEALNQLAAMAAASRKASEQTLQLKQDLDSTRQRLDQLESDIRIQQQISSTKLPEVRKPIVPNEW